MLQAQPQPHNGGNQFGGNSAVHNPYKQPTQQQHGVSNNPYQQPQQQDFQAHDGMPTNDMPPMQEVVVQNNNPTQNGLSGKIMCTMIYKQGLW